MDLPFQYKTRFENVVSASSNFDDNFLVSKASLEDLKKIIPASVDLTKNIDLVGVAFNAAVINRFNKNGDGIDTDTAIAFKKYFIHKPTNIEHKKQRVVGHIVSAAFTSFGKNEVIDEQQVVKKYNPFNLGLGAVVYKSVDREFADALIESGDQTSKLYQQISASWEIGFNEYLIAVGSIDLKDAEIISKKEHIAEYKKYLRGFDGPGTLNDGTPVYRLVTGRIYPLGIGFTTNPAADVKGVVVDTGSLMDAEEEENDTEAEVIEVNTSDIINLKNNNFSQNNKTTVNTTKINNMDLDQIISAFKEVLSQKEASQVNFSEEAVANISVKIADSIKAKNEEMKKEMENVEKAKKEVSEKAEKLEKDLDDTKKNLAEATERINELQKNMESKAAQEIFSARMSALDSDYDFSDADRQILANEVKALDSSEQSFASYKERVAVIYSHKSKAYKQEQDRIFQERLEAEIAKRVSQTKVVEPATTAVASESVHIETALANATVQELSSPAIPQNIAVSEQTLSWKEKVSKAFSKENITVKY
jgi:hypothetical protein